MPALLLPALAGALIALPCAPSGAPESPGRGLGEAASAPFSAFGEDGAFLLVWESRGEGESDIRFSRREPGPGGSWLPEPLRLNRGSLPGAARALEPRVAAGREGRVAIVWQDARDGRDEVYLQRSADGGRTFGGDELRVSRGTPGEHVSSMPFAAWDGAGRLYVAYEDMRHGDRDVYLSRFPGGALGFEVRVDADEPGAGASYHPQVAAWEDGTVLVTWWDQRDGLSDVYVRRARNAGEAWGSELRLDPGRPGGAASSDVRLLAGKTDVVISWTEGLGPDAVSLARVSRDRGRTWEETLAPAEPVPPLAPVGPLSSTGGIGADGCVHVAWVGGPRGDLLFSRHSAAEGRAREPADQRSQQQERQQEHSDDEQR